jgi:DNA-binding NarL/FixJ family response regulator
MKLLLIDKQDLSTFAREEVLRDQYHHEVDYAFTFEEFKKKYAAGKYRIIILDFMLEVGAKALEEIDRLDPKQRVIILSASEAYSEPHGCAYCVEHYNRRRLKKPVGVMELADLIRDFDYASCSHYHE